ncbi:hypothetical protein EBU95_19160, partial [bacterium]|nr:hypothetical protein [bacterium]
NKLTKNQTITQQLLTLGETYLNNDTERLRTLIESNRLYLENSNQALSARRIQIGCLSERLNVRISTIQQEKYFLIQK